MQLNFFKDIINEISNIDISNFIKEIEERLEKMEQELVIDRFEGNIAICEDNKTGKKVEIDKQNLSKQCREGNIIKEQNGKYVIDQERQKENEDRIKDKMNKIWKN